MTPANPEPTTHPASHPALPAAARPHRPHRPRRRAALATLAAAGLAAAACSGCMTLKPPQPWEKGELARPVMGMDRDPLEARFQSHVYFSKEAASGGEGVGGGGCGCN